MKMTLLIVVSASTVALFDYPDTPNHVPTLQREDHVNAF